MNKNELIASIASETGLTKTDSAKALDAFVASITNALKKGDEVRLVGFGTLPFLNVQLLPAAIRAPAQLSKSRLANRLNSKPVKLCKIL